MRYAPGLLLLLAAAGCGVETDPRPASFRYIQDAILRPSCATAACHSTLNTRALVDLDDEALAYDFWNAGSPKEASPMYRVIGGEGVDPDVSDLGVRMPLDAPLPQADILLIGRWIDDGAEYN